MSDESRPFKGPFRIGKVHPETKIKRAWCELLDGSGQEPPCFIFLTVPQAEQLRLALSLLELLPEIEKAAHLNLSYSALSDLRAKLAALKEPRT